MTFAFHHLHLGDEVDPSGAAGWSKYGYDLDGKTTTAASTNVCTLATNANKKNQTDGAGGIDNSFGENIIPLLGAVSANPSVSADSALAAGTYGWIFSVQGLSADPAQSSTGLTGEFFLGVPFGQSPNSPGAKPTFTVADNWPVDRTMVTSPVLADGGLFLPAVSTNQFSKAYVVGGEVVSGLSAPLDLVIQLAGTPLRLTLQHAVITFHHASPTHAAGGIIAGVIATQDLVDAIHLIAGNLSTSLCSTAGFGQVEKSIRQAADILVDGTNVPGVPCDAISFGIGFDADEIQGPQSSGAFPATVNPCADGG